MTTLYTTMESPLGTLLLSGTDDGTGTAVLTAVTAPQQKYAVDAPLPDWRPAPGAFTVATEQLTAYFAGELTAFSLPLAPVGTDFRQRVWQALEEIPYGSTATYGQLAAAAGESPRAVRAVGGAVGANPLLVVRPCHRVIGANGSLTGFAAGVDRKRWLLGLESGGLF
ncbi:methylated-DNA--[protein]-cysteine S-methyltransferase [Streptomyces sp. NPDC092296]|uniref:methylated-DNA--[protein]-cysteine S-methyltransferase n=1 Tax=Streptomyces sp. NPDC092296 TaxID=3366012 RepID=UPI00381C14F5